MNSLVNVTFLQHRWKNVVKTEKMASIGCGHMVFIYGFWWYCDSGRILPALVNISAVLIWEIFEDLRYMAYECQAWIPKKLRNKLMQRCIFNEDLRSLWSGVSQERFRDEHVWTLH